MSTSAIRRVREYGPSGGGTVTAAVVAKPSKSLSQLSTVKAVKSSAGKENPRPPSRGRASVATMAQKPVIRSLPRIDKSTSSVPRGRSSSSSEFNMVLSDLRKDRVSRVPATRGEPERSASRGRNTVNGTRVSEKIPQKKGSSKDLNEKSSEESEIRVVSDRLNSLVSETGNARNREISEQCEPNSRASQEVVVKVSGRIQQKNGTLKDSNTKLSEGSENGRWALKECKNSDNAQLGMEKNSQDHKECEFYTKGSEGVRVGASDELKDANLNSISTKSCFEGLNSNCSMDSNFKVSIDARVYEELKSRSSVDPKSASCVEMGGKELGRRNLNSSREPEILKPKGSAEEGTCGGSINKYPSRLHEKLAFLEGKVNRIASDIKKTKDMLDMNNTDASKAILSDIQEKISGIEKAIGSVNCADGKIGLTKYIENGNSQGKPFDKIQNMEVGHSNSSVKDLNTEELEARLFPHHKLIRDRTSLKVPLNNLTDLVKSISVTKREELGSINENSIASEFLASLNNQQSKITTRSEFGRVEFTEVQETEGIVTSTARDSSKTGSGEGGVEMILTTDERLEGFDDQENRPSMAVEEETEDSLIYQLNGIGHKTATGGWFVSEGEAVLLAHGDGSCSFYDIINCEEKAEYMPPTEVSLNLWRDCWIVRAPGADGCSGRYVVAASAGNTLDSGFCSWDFYNKDVRAFHIEEGIANYSRTALAALPNNAIYRRNTLSSVNAPENQQWWYKPCGPLLVSTASCQRAIRVYDIRDGEQILKWEVQKPVVAMNYSSPLQWRNRGKVVVAEAGNISLWDVSSLNSEALLTVSSRGRKVSALHVNNTDAEPGGGVRQRVSSSEAEGNDGLFCTTDSINILDFRHPSGIGLKIPKTGVHAESVFSRGDSIFLGCTDDRSLGIKQPCSQVQQFSLRKQKIFGTYSLPQSNAHSHHTDLTQVWGNSNHAMGVCGWGLFVFDALNNDGTLNHPLSSDCGNAQKVREVIGPDDMYSPSFDYLGSRVLIISRDRPALWRYL